MAINYIEFSERFEKLKPSPVYLFSGEERFFIDEGIKAVREKFLDESARDFNYDIYSASDIAASKVVEMAETLPVMARCRVVIVKDIDGWSSKERETMISYINQPSPSTCLILTATKLDRREKFSAAIEKKGMIILCQPLYKQGLTAWLRQRVRQAGRGIENEALHMLADISGNDIGTLNNEIEKLILYCGDRKSISTEDVATVSSGMKSVTVFEVVNAMIEKRFKEAVFYLKRAIDEGEPPVRIFYFIVREFRLMLKARILIDAGDPPDAAARAVGIPPFKVSEFSQRVQKIPKKELYKLFGKLMETDLKLKGGALKPAMALEELLLFS